MGLIELQKAIFKELERKGILDNVDKDTINWNAIQTYITGERCSVKDFNPNRTFHIVLKFGKDALKYLNIMLSLDLKKVWCIDDEIQTVDKDGIYSALDVVRNDHYKKPKNYRMDTGHIEHIFLNGGKYQLSITPSEIGEDTGADYYDVCNIIINETIWNGSKATRNVYNIQEYGLDWHIFRSEQLNQKILELVKNYYKTPEKLRRGLGWKVSK